MKQPLNEQFIRMQKLAGVITENQINEESYPSDKMLELVKMYVDNHFDEGMSGEAALNKIDEILSGKLDGYDKAFLKGEEDLYENQITEDQSDSLLTLVSDYVDWTYTADQGYGTVNVDGKEMNRTKYAALQLEKIKPEIIKLKGEQYFEDVEEFASLSTVAEEYSGEDLTDELEAAALKLGFSLEDLT
jgi:hypothetical protein